MKKNLIALIVIAVGLFLSGCGLSTGTLVFENGSTVKPFTMTAEVRQLSDGALAGRAEDLASGQSASFVLPPAGYVVSATASDGSSFFMNLDLPAFQTLRFKLGN